MKVIVRTFRIVRLEVTINEEMKTDVNISIQLSFSRVASSRQLDRCKRMQLDRRSWRLPYKNSSYIFNILQQCTCINMCVYMVNVCNSVASAVSQGTAIASPRGAAYRGGTYILALRTRSLIAGRTSRNNVAQSHKNWVTCRYAVDI